MRNLRSGARMRGDPTFQCLMIQNQLLTKKVVDTIEAVKDNEGNGDESKYVKY